MNIAFLMETSGVQTGARPVNNGAASNRFRGAWRWLASFALGSMIGILFHYALYRIGLPLEPFIYMAF
jgi:hypothetical protein